MAVRSPDLEHEIHALRSMVERLVSDGPQYGGASVRRLEEELAAARAGRDDLAAALGAVSADHERAQTKARLLSARLESVTADLEHMTAQRVAFQQEVERLQRRQTDGEQAQMAVVDALVEQLRTVIRDRDALAAELAQVRPA